MTQQSKIEWSLLSLRLGVFIVMFMWTLDKFINPEHAANIFSKFYGLNVDVAFFTVIALAQLVLILAFLAGLYKRFTYGLIALLHAGSTLSSFGKYLEPFDNLLFFAAWPMLAACITLYLLRDLDTKWTLTKR